MSTPIPVHSTLPPGVPLSHSTLYTLLKKKNLKKKLLGRESTIVVGNPCTLQAVGMGGSNIKMDVRRNVRRNVSKSGCKTPEAAPGCTILMAASPRPHDLGGCKPEAAPGCIKKQAASLEA